MNKMQTGRFGDHSLTLRVKIVEALMILYIHQ